MIDWILERRRRRRMPQRRRDVIAAQGEGPR
jgi:hypothetical protein